jgi:uncharacterized membrane protein SpoIIM required for sporulation
MPYCIKCGTQLPADEAAKFCPNCGAAIVPTMRHEQAPVARKEPYERLEIATTRNRVKLMLVTLVLCFIITSAGALAQIEFSEADSITQEFQTWQDILGVVGLQIIFGNNLMHCLFMFIPGVGPFYGFYVLYSTGKVLAALGLMTGENPLLLFISLFIYPHAWLEYVSYSLAISENLWLIHAARKYQTKGFRNELSTAAKVMAICAILLLIAAIAEMSIISSALS